MPTQELERVTLPYDDVLSLVFGDEYVASQPFSFGPCLDLLHPEKVRVSVGIVLKALDPHEERVHVDIFSAHAEVWPITHWRESLVHRTQLRESMDFARARQEVINTLAEALAKALGSVPSKAATMAEQVWRAGPEATKQFCTALGLQYDGKLHNGNRP